MHPQGVQSFGQHTSGHLRIVMPPLGGGKLGLVVKSLVVSAVADTKALELGFLPGDRILAVNDRPVGSTQEFYCEVSKAMEDSRASGEPVVFDLWRKKEGDASTGSAMATTPMSGSFSCAGSEGAGPFAGSHMQRHTSASMASLGGRVGTPQMSPSSGSFACSHHSYEPAVYGYDTKQPALPRGSLRDPALRGPEAGSTSRSSATLRPWFADSVAPPFQEEMEHHHARGKTEAATLARRQKELCPAFCHTGPSHRVQDAGPGAAPRVRFEDSLTVAKHSVVAPGPSRRRKFIC